LATEAEMCNFISPVEGAGWDMPLTIKVQGQDVMVVEELSSAPTSTLQTTTAAQCNLKISATI